MNHYSSNPSSDAASPYYHPVSSLPQSYYNELDYFIPVPPVPSASIPRRPVPERSNTQSGSVSSRTLTPSGSSPTPSDHNLYQHSSPTSSAVLSPEERVEEYPRRLERYKHYSASEKLRKEGFKNPDIHITIVTISGHGNFKKQKIPSISELEKTLNKIINDEGKSTEDAGIQWYFVVEDPSPEEICILGGYFNIDPAFFVSHVSEGEITETVGKAKLVGTYNVKHF